MLRRAGHSLAMKQLMKILQSFEWNSALDMAHSLVPSQKYGAIPLTITLSAALAFTEHLLGMNIFSVLFFALALAVELYTGLKASRVKGEKLSSTRMSRFGVKLASYLIIIGMFWGFRKDAARESQHLLASLFTYLWAFSLLYVAAELSISILENLAVIDGKPKDAYIQKIKDKFKLF